MQQVRINSIRSSLGKGFSLIEMTVAMAIFSIMAIFLFMIINSTTKITSSTSSRLDANRVARECLDLIGKDLKSVMLPYYNSPTSPGLQMVVNPPGVDARFSNPHNMFWQAPVSSSSNGNLAVLGYFVIQDIQLSNTRKNRLQLRRLYVEPENTATPPTTPSYFIYSSPTDWFPTALLNQFAPATFQADNDAGQKGWVADGVLAMYIRCLDPRGALIIRTPTGTVINYSYDSRTSYRYVDAGPNRYPNMGGSALPGFIEVTLICCSPRDASRIKVIPTYNATSSANYLADITTFKNAVRNQNPQAKSIDSFSRKFRLYTSP